jgi:hypothetical protein
MRASLSTRLCGYRIIRMFHRFWIDRGSEHRVMVGVLDQTQVPVQRSSLSIQFNFLTEMPRHLFDGSLDSYRRLYSVVASR